MFCGGRWIHRVVLRSSEHVLHTVVALFGTKRLVERLGHYLLPATRRDAITSGIWEQTNRVTPSD